MANYRPLPARPSPEILLSAYSAGLFPMSNDADDPDVFWVCPERRGILPLNSFHVSRSLARRIRKRDYLVRIDFDFEATLAGCADRPATWMNGLIRALHAELHRMGHAHSVEVYGPDDRLIGGVYGVSIGGAFFGESMFSRQRDGSKIALAHLVARLLSGGFTLFDVQFLTPHLASLGATEITASAYRSRLRAAIAQRGDFFRLPCPTQPSTILHAITQTS